MQRPLVPDDAARGRLWLWRTSANDRSLRDNVVPAPGDTVGTPFYGVTSVDRAAMIPYDRRIPKVPVDTIPPAVDPIYPHILVSDRRGVREAVPYRTVQLLRVSIPSGPGSPDAFVISVAEAQN